MIAEYVMKPGQFSISLAPDTPRSVLRRIDVELMGFSQLVVTSTYQDPKAISDETMLSLARYVGIYREQDETGLVLGGSGVNSLLGEDNQKSDIIEGEKSTVNGWPSQWWAIMTPAILTKGFWDNPGNVRNLSYTGKFRFVTFREAWDTLATAFGIEWRVSNTFQLEAGRVEAMYRANPNVVILGDSAGVGGGKDLYITGISGSTDLSRDLNIHAVRAVYLTGDEADPKPTAVGPTGSSQYFGPHGNPLPLDVLIEAYNDTSDNPTAMATAHLGRYAGLRTTWTVNSDGLYDIGLDTPIGSPIWLYDPEAGLFDMNNPVVYRGHQIYPVRSRLMGLESPVLDSNGVYLRRKVGVGGAAEYIDLTPYVVPETGAQKVTIGAVPDPSR